MSINYRFLPTERSDFRQPASIIFYTKNLTWLNLLRRAIMAEIETYTIEIVVFHINDTALLPELLALRLGQLVIDQRDGRDLQDQKFKLDITAQNLLREVTTDDLPGLKFQYRTPILTLRQGQRLHCDCIVKKGTGRTHVKWRPVARCHLTEVEDGYQMNFENLGMLSQEEIVRQGLIKMAQASQQPAQSIFTRVVVPNQFYAAQEITETV